MSEETVDERVVEVEVTTEETVDEAEQSPIEPTDEGGKDTGSGAKAEQKKPSHNIKDALKQVESFGQALSEALQGRGNVVMVRVNDEALEHLDMLVEAEITKSRSESAAFLIGEGISANEALFGQIREITDQIAALREQLREEVKLEPQEPEGETDA
ncbi:MAG: hypothetical protein ACP5HG_01345 [Anaerolineae bacterium]